MVQHLNNWAQSIPLLLDKTGTLTEGKPQVTDVIANVGFNEKELLMLASSAEVGSHHPSRKKPLLIKHKEQQIDVVEADNPQRF